MKIIAETASNHMGELDYLKDLSLQSHLSGADLVTVQVFDLDSFVTPFDEQSFSNFQKVYITQDDWLNYFNWCKKEKISVLPCVLDYTSAELCFNEGFKSVKLHASDIINLKFIEYINSRFDKVFLEFGGADISEISLAVKKLKDTKVILLYGFNAYPTKIENQNLNFLVYLSKNFLCDVGFCDHSVNNDVIPLLAMAKGASYLEKHVSLDSSDQERFDWQVSVNMKEFKNLIFSIQKYLPSFGDKLRFVSDSELKFRKIMYKKIVARRKINKNEILKIEDIDFKRSIEGVESSFFNKIIGKKARFNIKKDQVLKLSDFG